VAQEDRAFGMYAASFQVRQNCTKQNRGLQQLRAPRQRARGWQKKETGTAELSLTNIFLDQFISPLGNRVRERRSLSARLNVCCAALSASVAGLARHRLWHWVAVVWPLPPGSDRAGVEHQRCSAIVDRMVVSAPDNKGHHKIRQKLWMPHAMISLLRRVPSSAQNPFEPDTVFNSGVWNSSMITVTRNLLGVTFLPGLVM
jgi:hypothetical protein